MFFLWDMGTLFVRSHAHIFIEGQDSLGLFYFDLTLCSLFGLILIVLLQSVGVGGSNEETTCFFLLLGSLFLLYILMPPILIIYSQETGILQDVYHAASFCFLRITFFLYPFPFLIPSPLLLLLFPSL